MHDPSRPPSVGLLNWLACNGHDQRSRSSDSGYHTSDSISESIPQFFPYFLQVTLSFLRRLAKVYPPPGEHGWTKTLSTTLFRLSSYPSWTPTTSLLPTRFLLSVIPFPCFITDETPSISIPWYYHLNCAFLSPPQASPD